MHNKFAIVDDYLLLTGSFNWTDNAVNRNCENILITSDIEVIKKYKDEFNKLWNKFNK